MQGRSFMQDIGEFAQYLNTQNQRARAQQIEQQRMQQQRIQQQQLQRQRDQQQTQQRQQQQHQSSKKQEGGGVGYFMAALIGVAAGFIAKSFFSEEEKPTRREPENYPPQGSYYNQQAPVDPNPQPVDPVDSELEECNDLVCPITLELMREPMISKKCGHSFEQDAIVSWSRTRNFCPKCHAPLQQSDLVKNYSLKNAIEYMRKQAKTKDSQEAGQA